MSNYQEGMIAVFVCLTVFNFALVGTVIYYIMQVSQMQKESNVERLKVHVLIESMIEIFESKYKMYDDENESDSGSGNIPRRD